MMYSLILLRNNVSEWSSLRGEIVGFRQYRHDSDHPNSTTLTLSVLFIPLASLDLKLYEASSVQHTFIHTYAYLSLGLAVNITHVLCSVYREAIGKLPEPHLCPPFLPSSEVDWRKGGECRNRAHQPCNIFCGHYAQRIRPQRAVESGQRHSSIGSAQGPQGLNKLLRPIHMLNDLKPTPIGASETGNDE